MNVNATVNLNRQVQYAAETNTTNVHDNVVNKSKEQLLRDKRHMT